MKVKIFASYRYETLEDEIFEFAEYEEDYETLPYKDFLFYRNDYEMIKIVEC